MKRPGRGDSLLPVLSVKKHTMSLQYGIREYLCTYLDETDGCRLLTEALTTEVKAVLADKTSLMRAEAAIESILYHI